MYTHTFQCPLCGEKFVDQSVQATPSGIVEVSTGDVLQEEDLMCWMCAPEHRVNLVSGGFTGTGLKVLVCQGCFNTVWVGSAMYDKYSSHGVEYLCRSCAEK